MVNIIEPISEPTKILGIGLNYTDGADEMVKKRYISWQTDLILLSKLQQALSITELISAKIDFSLKSKTTYLIIAWFTSIEKPYILYMYINVNIPKLIAICSCVSLFQEKEYPTSPIVFLKLPSTIMGERNILKIVKL